MQHKVVLTGTKAVPVDVTPDEANSSAWGEAAIAAATAPRASIKLKVEYDEGAEGAARELLVEMIAGMRHHLGAREGEVYVPGDEDT